MQRRRIVVPALALALATTVILVAGRGEPEPKWKGRSLSSWLKLYQHRTTGELTVAQIDEAPAALKEIGTNALPWLLKWVQYEPPGKFSRALQAPFPGKLARTFASITPSTGPKPGHWQRSKDSKP